MARRDFYTALVLIAFSTAVFFEALRMPYYPERGGTLLTAPGLVPGALGLILALCGIIMLLQSTVWNGQAAEAHARAGLDAGGELLATAIGVTGLGQEADAGVEPEAEPAPEPPGAANRRVLLMAVLGIGYAAGLIGLIPFWLATFIFVFLAIVLFEWRREYPWAKRLRRLAAAFAVAAVTAVSVTYVFQEIFLVRLP